jgi:hypothetical protein
MVRFILVPVTAIVLLAACAGEPDCDPMRAFEQARKDRDADPACRSDAYADARRIGQTLGEMERERDELAERADSLDVSERMRLRVLQRDIPQLEAVARIEGYTGPAKLDLPDRDN